MSLHAAAQHLAAHGRGDDKVLVHMTPGEVRSLQELAKAHGGSLTINPKTGLPEAGFLSAIIPTVIGAGVTAATGNPYAGAAAAAAYGYANTGTVGGTFMAGLQGYGGGSLAQGMAFGANPEDLLAAQEAAASEAAAREATREQLTREALRTSTETGLNELSVHAGEELSAGVNELATHAGDIPPPVPPEVPPTVDPYAPTRTAFGAHGEAPLNGFEGSQFEPRPGITPENYGQGLGTKTAASLAADPYAGLSNAQILAKNATFSNMAYAFGPAVIADMQQRRGLPRQNMSSSAPNPVYKYTSGAYTPTPRASARGYEQYYYDPYSSGYTRTAADGGMMYGGDVQGDPNLMQVKTYDPVVRMKGGGRSEAADTTPMKKPKGLSEMEGYKDMSGIDNTVGLYGSGGPTGKEAALVNALQNSGFGAMDQIARNASFLTPPNAQLQAIFGRQNPNENPEYSYDPSTQEYTQKSARGGLADAHYNLGGYSDGGRLLKGPGDGVSDSIPAVIGQKQPARLADGEFVVPARIVSEIGNGSTEAGARKLYAMMDRVQKARAKTTGKGKIAKNTRADRYLPA